MVRRSDGIRMETCHTEMDNFGIENTHNVLHREGMFEFDPEKSAANKAKHGIDFVAAQAIWDDEENLTVNAKSGSDGEPRLLVIGNIDGRLWSAVVTDRDGRVRLISVRRSRDDEKELYHGRPN